MQIRGDRFDATARDATPEERPELWKQMTEIWPDYDGYQERTDREIPIVILERTNLERRFGSMPGPAVRRGHERHPANRAPGSPPRPGASGRP